MANAPQKITLAPARPIPFNKLVLSQANVRRVKAGASIEELAESIARRGLIQSLHVRPVLDAEDRETGMYEVPAGGRRYRALELLVKQKRLNKTSPVPCIVSDPAGGILIDEISLAENVERAPLHPLDQFRAFQAMRDKGMSEEATAAAFFIDVKVVKQRLRLAEVAPALLDVYAADGMTLEMLMAFTVTPDHARQEQVWAAVQNSWQKEPYQIRRLLTEKAVAAGDKRAAFVGIEAYEEAGGIVLRDLFEADRGGWLQDVALLDRLVDDRLKAAAEAIAGEGWKWIEVAIGFPYGHQAGLRLVYGEPVALSEEERAAIDALTAEQERLIAEHEADEELPEAVDDRLGEIEAALEELGDRPLRYDPAEIARAGAFVSLGHDGRLQVQRGYVRPEDEAPAMPEPQDGNGEAGDERAREPAGPGPTAMPAVQRAIIQIGGAPAAPEPEEEDGIRPLSDRLLSELTAHRTLALRDAVANDPQVALTLLLHKLVLDTFHFRTGQGCLEARVREVHLAMQADDLKDSACARAVAERHAAWKEELPEDDNAVWDWLAALDEASRMALLAHCVSFGVNALHEKPNPYGGMGVTEHGLRMRLAQADRLARATGLDMVAAGWRPTVGNYLGRVTKARILEAVREGAGADKAQLVDHLRKGEMAREAERLLAETGWLPEPLRPAADLDAAVEAPEQAAGPEEAEALPAFLSGETGEADRGDEAEAFRIAAE
ncbi:MULTISPECIES: ParB/RepB/Spo0J family partition protein [Methylobacterium]|uniref:ParB/RepB/Spo0J family partition protein n=1 Tax=Methylobacterium TaxID=407 RepID=UPI0013EAEE70|nr:MULTISPECIES: ParB/RepB/Spo0J family partition protein [unclassified Methylobacterium]NGM37982.1 ParB N-terminal domain-containing protein [Methylobacterium sp. DB0501]